MIFNSIRWRLTFLMIFVAILPMIAVGAYYLQRLSNRSEPC